MQETARMSYEPRRLEGNEQKALRRELGEGRKGKTTASRQTTKRVHVVDGSREFRLQRGGSVGRYDVEGDATVVCDASVVRDG
jgi:hypothetical protein